MFLLHDDLYDDAVAKGRGASPADRLNVSAHLADNSLIVLDTALADTLKGADATLDDDSSADDAPVLILPGMCPICGSPGYDDVYCGYCNNGAF